MNDRSGISPQVLAMEPEMLQWRRHFHQYPELSFQENETSAYIEAQLRSFGNIEVTRPTPTSVMGVIKGKTPGRVIALRADIDALPMTEKNDLPFASVREGAMHSCGHDAHAAMLLAAAKCFSSMTEQLSGEVRLLFQHAEELPPGGAAEMMKAGVMEGVDEIYGLHVSSNYETCTFGIRSGALTSATDRFDIVIKGKGGHSAFPETTVDPVVIGAQVITGLQSIVSRQTAAVDTVVLSICQVQAGQAYNIVPGEMSITGSTRTFDKGIREALPGRMERIAKGITSAYGADYEFTFSKGYASVINDEKLTANAQRLIAKQFGEKACVHIGPLMPGEDFSAFLENCPGCFLELGTRNAEKGCDQPHHNCNYMLDEDALVFGVEFYRQLILDRLS